MSAIKVLSLTFIGALFCVSACEADLDLETAKTLESIAEVQQQVSKISYFAAPRAKGISANV